MPEEIFVFVDDGVYRNSALGTMARTFSHGIPKFLIGEKPLESLVQLCSGTGHDKQAIVAVCDHILGPTYSRGHHRQP